LSQDRNELKVDLAAIIPMSRERGQSALVRGGDMTLRDLVYTSYAKRARPVMAVHRRLFCTRSIAERLFDMEIVGDHVTPYYFDLSTLVLRHELRRRVSANPDLRILEVGAGAYAVLCGSLSRSARKPIDAVELCPARAANSRLQVVHNHLNVTVYESNVFSALPAGRYDLIFWNLPYYRDVATYLTPLLANTHDRLTESGQLLIAYNARVLSRSRILELLASNADLRMADVLTRPWHLHEVMVIERAHEPAVVS
jgi:methylase of polypeptide subunit release factors